MATLLAHFPSAVSDYFAAAFLPFFSAEGVATTAGAAATGSATFLETVFVDLAEEVFIVLVAVEVFMAGIRTRSIASHSIFEACFHFWAGRFFYQ